MAFIKSHSNYVLAKKHQNVSDGTIFERDITTIGGLDQFSKGQRPIYKSSNFIITVRDDGKVSNQYNKRKWSSNDSSGETWTMDSLEGMVSSFEDQDDVKIVLKQDYHDLCDFAYYGSLSELFRASVGDILKRFPGELYHGPDCPRGYYKTSKTEDFQIYEDLVPYGENDEELYIVTNPFGIDIHTAKKPTEADPLKYFAEFGYKNYELFEGDSNEGQEITTYKVDYETKDSFKAGDKLATITINDKTILAYLNETCTDVVYLIKDNTSTFHIRPNSEYIAKFYNECDNFEKLLVNLDTTPLYKATFSIVRDNELGYYRELQDFVFPTSEGGYNLDASSYGFTEYTSRMAEIGEYYDSLFTDNLWRSMTHEAIRNFDWSFTREFYQGDEEEFVFGGQKIQKVIRLFGREFDEIMSYINNFKSMNKVTYDEKGNLADYFLVDDVENKGWDTKLVYPYDLIEYSVTTDETTKEKTRTEIENDDKTKYSNSIQLDNGDDSFLIEREFFQDSTTYVFPYSLDHVDEKYEKYKYGYFMVCAGECNPGVIPPRDCNCGDLVIQETPFPDDGGGDEGGDDEPPKSKIVGTVIDPPCEYEDMPTGEKDCSKVQFFTAKDSASTYFDCCSNDLRHRIKPYSDDDKSYTYHDMGNEFLRRLSIGSAHILKHKGTIEGMEMLLSLFGLKSQRWVDNLTEAQKKCRDWEPDYELTEFTSFANRVEEQWDAVHQMYRLDWVNSTKAIVYDYRSKSNYTKYGAPTEYISYQGLPIAYRDERLEYKAKEADSKGFIDFEDKLQNKPYIKVSPLKFELTDSDGEGAKLGQDETNNESNDAFKDINRANAPVKKRYLYPIFNKDEQIDGNPYFQMDGGWLSKILVTEDGNYNFQLDVDDNVVHTDSIDYCDCKFNEETQELIDNEYLFKETVRNIKRVDTIGDLLTIPMDKVDDKEIYYVSNIEKDVAIIDNTVYKIKHEYYNGNVINYVSLIKSVEYLKVGGDKFFDDTVLVYDKDGEMTSFTLQDKEAGFEIKAYIKDVEEGSAEKAFICQSTYEGEYTIENFMILDKLEEEEDADTLTNYFIIDDRYYSNKLATTDNPNGWRRLHDTDKEYIKINTIIDYYKGNNPHNGNMRYDKGHEYYTYFTRLFKYSIDNDLFDERCYESFYHDLETEIWKYGFKFPKCDKGDLLTGCPQVNENEEIKTYTALTDMKVHYFGNYYKFDESNEENPTKTECKKVKMYGESENNKIRLQNMYRHTVSGLEVTNYILNSEDDMLVESPYSGFTENVDEITHQIVNNKLFRIKFLLHFDWYTHEGQCELKYLDDIVLHYLTQMIPSTAILEVQYEKRDGDMYKTRWVDSGTECDNVKHIKYTIQKRQKSKVGEDNWTDMEGATKRVNPQYNSVECGYVAPMYRKGEATRITNNCKIYEVVQNEVSYDGGTTYSPDGTSTTTYIGIDENCNKPTESQESGNQGGNSGSEGGQGSEGGNTGGNEGGSGSGSGGNEGSSGSGSGGNEGGQGSEGGNTGGNEGGSGQSGEGGNTGGQDDEQYEYSYSEEYTECVGFDLVHYKKKLRRPKGTSQAYQEYGEAPQEVGRDVDSETCTDFGYANERYTTETVNNVKTVIYYHKKYKALKGTQDWVYMYEEPYNKEVTDMNELGVDENSPTICYPTIRYYDYVDGEWVLRRESLNRSEYMGTLCPQLFEFQYGVIDGEYICDNDAHTKYEKLGLMYRRKNSGNEYTFVKLSAYNESSKINDYDVFKRGNVIGTEGESMDCGYNPPPEESYREWEDCDPNSNNYVKFRKKTLKYYGTDEFVDDPNSPAEIVEVITENSIDCGAPCYYSVDADAYSVIFLGRVNRIGTEIKQTDKFDPSYNFEYQTGNNTRDLIARAFVEEGKPFNNDVMLECGHGVYTIANTPNKLVKYIAMSFSPQGDGMYFSKVRYHFELTHPSISTINITEFRLDNYDDSPMVIDSPCSDYYWLSSQTVHPNLSANTQDVVENYSFSIVFDEIELKHKDSNGNCDETVASNSISGTCVMRGQTAYTETNSDGKVSFSFPLSEVGIGNLTINFAKSDSQGGGNQGGNEGGESGGDEPTVDTITIDTDCEVSVATFNTAKYLENVSIKLDLMRKNGSLAVPLTNGEYINIINSPCSDPIDTWKSEITNTLHFNGEIEEPITDYYLRIAFNNRTLKEKDENSEECSSQNLISSVSIFFGGFTYGINDYITNYGYYDFELQSVDDLSLIRIFLDYTG